MSFAGANFRDVQARTRTVPLLAAFYSASPITVLGADEPVRPRVSAVTGEFFNIMGVPPVMGRTFAPGEGTVGGPTVAVVGHAFWRTTLGGSRCRSW